MDNSPNPPRNMKQYILIFLAIDLAIAGAVVAYFSMR